jgi:hydroxypyruvate isomerase
MLKFSANLSLLFTELTLPERFAAARAAGFDAVEVQFPYDFPAALLKRILHEQQQDLVLINVPAGDLMQGGDGLACVPGREREFREAVAQAARYAETLDVVAVNVLAGRQPEGEDLLDCLHTLADNLDYAADAFQSVGVMTTFEAINTYDMPRFLIHNLPQMQEMLEIVDHPMLKMQFDIYHMARMGEPVAMALEENIQDIGHIQFADIPNRHEPGTGELDFPKLFKLIEELPYHGWCGAEYRPRRDTASSLNWLGLRP